MKKLDIADIAQAEQLVAENAEQIEPGLRVIDSHLLVGHTVVNLVALDASESLVLVLLDLAANDDTLLRAVDAFSWCLEYPETIQRLYPDAQFSLERPPRILFAVPRCPESFLRKAKRLGFPAVDCVELRFFEANGAAAVFAEHVAQLRSPSAFGYPPDVEVATGGPTRAAGAPRAKNARPAAVPPAKAKAGREAPVAEPRPEPAEREQPHGGEWETFLDHLGVDAQARAPEAPAPRPASPAAKPVPPASQPAPPTATPAAQATKPEAGPESPFARLRVPASAEPAPRTTEPETSPSKEVRPSASGEYNSLRLVEGAELATAPASTNGVAHNATEITEPTRKWQAVMDELGLSALAQSDTTAPQAVEPGVRAPASPQPTKREERPNTAFGFLAGARAAEVEFVATHPTPVAAGSEGPSGVDSEAPTAAQAEETEAAGPAPEAPRPPAPGAQAFRVAKPGTQPDPHAAPKAQPRPEPAPSTAAPAAPRAPMRPPTIGKASWAATARKVEPGRIVDGVGEAHPVRPAGTTSENTDAEKRAQQQREWQEMLKQLGGNIHIPEGAELSPRWQEVLSQLGRKK